MKTFVRTILGVIMLTACESATGDISPLAPDSDTPQGLRLATLPGLVGWWPGEDDTDLAGNHDGSMGGGLTGGHPGGKRGGAFLFDGVDDEFVFGNSPFLDFTQASSFTFEAWIDYHGPTLNPAQAIISTNYRCTPTNQSLFILADGRLFFVVRDELDGQTLISTPSAITSNILHHVAGVREVGDTETVLKLYLDGDLVATDVDITTGALSLNTEDFIGRNWPCPTTNQFNGIIDEVKVYTRALTDEEILCGFECDETGPLVSNILATPSHIAPGASVELSARIDDSSVGAFVLAGADYSIDGGSFVAMVAADGHFDKPFEDVTATIAASALSGTHEICIQGRDRCGNTTVIPLCTTVTVDDAGPTTSGVIATPNPVQVGTFVLLSALVDDGDSDGSTIASAAYSLDGLGLTPMAASDGSFDEVAEAVATTVGPFADAGVHDACVSGVDEVGNGGGSECILLAVYDPSAGFVTGAGVIESPPGAYVDQPLATGLARFGFVSRYNKGQTIPSGDTQFIFRAVDLEFRSSSYEWLVISGARAQFKGVGTINGRGDYGFILTAIDGEISGGGGSDKFRIKIWDRTNGDAIVYDNQLGATDSGNNATELNGGQISIHAK